MDDAAIETTDLTVYYGARRGIEDVNLIVKAGEVFGFLGPNGAGKTTTLRVLLDVIRPDRGRASIFGLDCRKEGVTVRKRVGYLPGELNLDVGMKASTFLDLVAALHRDRVDPEYRAELCRRLDLDTRRTISEYSRGNKQKVGIAAAFMTRPDLLILDEPTSGLDPLIQQAVLEFVREVRDEGRTVFFSSHILPEVEAVCDRVGIIRSGNLIKVESVDMLMKQTFKRVRLSLARVPPPDAFAFDGVKETERDGMAVTLEIHRGLQAVMEKACEFGILDFDMPPVTLEEVFFTFYDSAGERQDA